MQKVGFLFGAECSRINCGFMLAKKQRNRNKTDNNDKSDNRNIDFMWNI